MFGNNPEHGDGQVNNGYDNSAAESNRAGERASSGPWSTRAGDQFNASRGLISSQEAAAATAATAAARAATCNGSTCKNATEVARLAYAASAGVAATAGSRLLSAEQLRKEMLAHLGSGRYSPEEVASVRNLLRDNPAPGERDLSALPEKVRDLAGGLGTNFREMKLLDEKRQQYGRVAANAQEMQRKLKGVVARAETLRPGAPTAIPGRVNKGGHENAEYPEKFSSAAGTNKDSEGTSAITGGNKAFLANGNLDLKFSATELNDSKPGTGAASTSGSSLTPLAQSSDAEFKKLTPQGADLIAGMISELDFDMSKKLPVEAPDGHGGNPAAGSEKFSASGVPEGSALEGIIQAITMADTPDQKAMEPRPTSTPKGGRSLASASGAGELDLLYFNKNLFQRVNDQMRRRAGKDL